jgi:hypothetical protein
MSSDPEISTDEAGGVKQLSNGRWNPLPFLVIVGVTVGISFVTIGLNFFSNRLVVYNSSPRVNFDAFATAVDENYAFFDLRGVDWKNITDRYDTLVDEGTSDDDLFDFFCEMYKPLQDPDTYLIKVSPSTVAMRMQTSSPRRTHLHVFRNVIAHRSLNGAPPTV